MSDSSILKNLKDLTLEVLNRSSTVSNLRLNLNANFFNSEQAKDPSLLYWFNTMMDHTDQTAHQYYKIYQDELKLRESSKRPHPFIGKLISNMNSSSEEESN